MFQANRNVFHWNISGKSTTPSYENMMHDFKITKKQNVSTCNTCKQPKKDVRMNISFIVN